MISQPKVVADVILTALSAAGSAGGRPSAMATR
jgi:hypothetical protein